MCRNYYDTYDIIYYIYFFTLILLILILLFISDFAESQKNNDIFLQCNCNFYNYISM